MLPPYSHQPQNAYDLHAQSVRAYGPIPQHASLQFDAGPQSHASHVSRTQVATTDPAFDVIGFNPSSAPPGSKLFIRVRSTQDLNYPALRVFVLFGDVRCGSSIQELNASDDHSYYAITTRVPKLDMEGGFDSAILELSLLLLDEADNKLGTTKFGVFSLNASEQHRLSDLVHDPSRKRRVSAESGISGSFPVKRASMQHLRGGNSGQSYVSYPPTVAVVEGTAAEQTYNQARSYHSSSIESPGHSPAHIPGVEPPSSFIPQQRRITTHSPSVSHGYYGPVMASGLPTRSKQRQTMSPSNKPPLIRTSTLYPTQITNAASGPSTQPFNPYSIYPTQAVLKIDQELDTMIYDWSEEEKKAQRRLVEFERSQTQSVIMTTFKPVSLDKRVPNSICVSCIWWEEKQEAFITSVDTIYLLESLVAVRFTVEEKNRIRRNLEGFRPMTVAKGKEDSDDFFKVIMGFPNPKPRNIEKDVKVFPWSILGLALKKIIGKYVSSESL